MNFYECKNFEILEHTRKRCYQEVDAMVFAFNNISGINISHCYISAPRGMYFFNLRLSPKLEEHTSRALYLLSAEEKRVLSRVLKKHSGRSLGQFGLGLYGGDEVHFFAQSTMIERIAYFFSKQEQVLGDLSFNYKWKEVGTRIIKQVGYTKDDSAVALQSLLELLETKNDWRDILEPMDWPFVSSWLQEFLYPRRAVEKANIIALKIVERLKWVEFYIYLVMKPWPFLDLSKEIAIEFINRRRSIVSELEDLYQFLTWEFPLEPKVI